jgi:glycerol-3-phosphate dehydrogenase (NAD(P)+)
LRIGIVGLGNLGSAISNLVSKNNPNKKIYGFSIEKKVILDVNKAHTNKKYLKGVVFDENVVATNDLIELFDKCNVVFFCIPTRFIESILLKVANKVDLKKKIIVNCSKGLTVDGSIVSQEIRSKFKFDLISMSGPSIANEFSKGFPAKVVLASKSGKNLREMKKVSKLLVNDYFKVEMSKDEIGVQLGGVLKNIYAIGLGIFDEHYSKSDNWYNLQGIYFSKVILEMNEFALSNGAKGDFSLRVSTIGDLIATSLSYESHHRSFGKSRVKCLNKKGVCEKKYVEGEHTIKQVLKIARKKKIKMPIANEIFRIIEGKKKSSALVEVVLS